MLGYDEELDADGLGSAEHLKVCDVDNCDRCEFLMQFYMACDNCGLWGNTSACHTGVVANGIWFCSERCAKEWFGDAVNIE